MSSSRTVYAVYQGVEREAEGRMGVRVEEM